jgi:hypothetical protein
MTARPAVELAVLDVGQGDTMVVSVPATREAIVIDCVDVDAVFAYLEDREITHLRGLVLTHLHLDHYRHAVRLLRNCERRLNLRCERIFFHWNRAGSPSDYNRLLRDGDAHDADGIREREAVRRRRTAHTELLDWTDQNPRSCKHLAREEDCTPFTGTFSKVLEIVHPWYGNLHRLSARSLNDTSAVLRVHGTATRALLTGDIEAHAWALMTKARVEELRADVLKFPHHGAWTADDPGEILDLVQPRVVIISVGTRGIGYDHPHQDVLTAIRERAPQIRLLCTQATEKCGPAEQVQSLASSAHADQPSAFLKPVRRRVTGCPCAGSVIVSLGETVEVIYPIVQFHEDQIIGQLLPNHQCALFRHLLAI